MSIVNKLVLNLYKNKEIVFKGFAFPYATVCWWNWTNGLC